MRTIPEKQNKINRKLLIRIGIVAFAIAVAAGFILTRAYMENSEPGWHNKGTEKAFYIHKNGERATGHTVIGDEAYLFTSDGDPKGKGWVDSKWGRYYCLGNGQLATGWNYVDGKVMYFYKPGDFNKREYAGIQAKNYMTSGGLKIPEKGYVDGDRGLALAYGIDVLNRYGWDLKSAYEYSSSLRFVEGPEDLYGFTIHSCALQGFEKGKGNCLVWSGTFCVMAKLLGYDCRHIWGTLEWNGTRPHAWTEIWTGDKVRVYDPRKSNGEGLAGFNVKYGSKGAYKYNLDSRQYLEW